MNKMLETDYITKCLYQEKTKDDSMNKMIETSRISYYLLSSNIKKRGTISERDPT